MDTKFAKPTVSTEVPDVEMLYCILHAQMVKVEASVCGRGHVYSDAWGEADYCCFEGGWTFTPPPDDDWAAQDDDQGTEIEADLEWLEGE